MIKLERKSVLFYSAIALLLGFQNCSDVKIEQASLPPVKTFADVSFSAEGCVNSVKLAPEKTKFVFVIDISRSNMGDFIKGKYNYAGVSYDGYPYWDPTQATDPLGVRFDAINNFVSSCGASTNNAYSVIAFSNSAGEISTDVQNHQVLNCTNRFVSSDVVSSQLSIMKQTQVTEGTYYSQFKLSDNKPFLAANATDVAPFIFKETNYVAATDCITSTIEADMAAPSNDTSNYQIFFLSDGEAVAKSTGCEALATTAAKIQCYVDKMDVKLSYLMKLSSAKSKPIRLHALYYTRDGQKNLSIESYMKYLASAGQTLAPVNMGSFQNLKGTENPFCKLLAVDKSIVYRSNKIYAVNMTATKVGAVIKRDSDADGIPDDEEASYGGDPYNAHSIVPGVLDGVCKIIGSKELCQKERDKIVCDPAKVNKFGISDCDVKILKLDKLAVRPELAGIDSDDDGIPDIVEILKGTSPINPDGYLDFDNDGLNNLQEISAGLDPFTPDATGDRMISSQATFKDQIDKCTSGGWHLDIDALSGPPGINKMMLFFRTESKNTAGVYEYRVNNSMYNVTTNPDSTINVDLSTPFVDVDQFELVTREISP